MSNQDRVAGGSFLTRDATPEEVFTPEEFTTEQRMVAKTARCSKYALDPSGAGVSARKNVSILAVLADAAAQC